MKEYQDAFHLNMTPQEIGTISSLGLAYVGEAVLELMVRTWLVARGMTDAGKMQRAALDCVCAAAQARAANRLFPLLTEEETAVYKRGRNAHPGGIPKNATVGEYHAATGMEALFGYLYMKGSLERLNRLFQAAREDDTYAT